jgi:hypothetical protein
MFAVTLFAGYVRRPVPSVGFYHLRMEFVLLGRVPVARQTAQRLDFFLVGNVVHVETGVARDTNKFAVDGAVQDFLVGKKRDLLSVALSRERLVAVAGQAVRLCLREE